MSRRPVDPLALIPSSEIVRQKLDEMHRQVSALEYLLSVASELEQRTAPVPEMVHQQREVSHAR